MDVAASYDGLHLCTIADDHSLKVFDVVNFGMFSICPSVCLSVSTYLPTYVSIYFYAYLSIYVYYL